jgi:hypothetical protein
MDDERSSQIQQFQQRFPTIPNILELDNLIVSGDVSFGRGVTLRGTVIGPYPVSLSLVSFLTDRIRACIVVANDGQKIHIPDGCVLENRLVSGDLKTIVRPLFTFPALSLIHDVDRSCNHTAERWTALGLYCKNIPLPPCVDCAEGMSLALVADAFDDLCSRVSVLSMCRIASL